MSRLALCLSLLAVVALATSAQATPISVVIKDYDFAFDTDLAAVYEYNGAGPDVLRVHSGGTEVASYRFRGTTGPVDLLGNSPGFYPIWSSSTPPVYGGDLQLDLSFVINDGPYVSGSDVLDISLAGSSGHLTITGIIGTPMPPVGSTPIVLLDMDFRATSLLGRKSTDVVDLIEAVGKVNVLLGEDVSAQDLIGTTFMKFFAEGGQVVFPDPPGQDYDPLTDYGYHDVLGRVSGEAGVPEPGSLLILTAGAAAVLACRRRGRRKV